VRSTVGFIEGNNDVSMDFYAKDTHIFDIVGGGEDTFESQYKKNKGLLDMIQTMTSASFRDMKIRVLGKDVAYARFYQEFAFTLKDGRKIDFVGRGTDLWLKRNGKWQVVDEHFSVPVDFKTGLANWRSTPASGYK
jgi:ketosteroid isomerase-like protein